MENRKSNIKNGTQDKKREGAQNFGTAARGSGAAAGRQLGGSWPTGRGPGGGPTELYWFWRIASGGPYGWPRGPQVTLPPHPRGGHKAAGA